MKVTKHRAPNGDYTVKIDGRETPLVICKQLGRREWGQPQEWDVCDDGLDAFLFTARSLEGAVHSIQRIADIARQFTTSNVEG